MTPLQQVIRNPFARYLLPFLLFLVLSSLQSLVKGPSVFWFYGAKMVLVLAAWIYLFRGSRREIEGTFLDWRAVLTGIFVLGIWILLCDIQGSGGETAFNPSQFESKALFFAAFLTKLTGSSLIIPLIEETVWRSFLMRFLIKEDFLSVPVGTYKHFSFWLTAVVFAAAHPVWQWPAAMLAGVVYGIFLVRTKNLKGCILAHGVTNLGLGVYVLLTGEWSLWV